MGVSENTVEKHVGKGIGVLMNALGRGGNDRFKASTAQDVEDPSQVDHDPRKQRRY
jgi:RNA polymerase sigma-70 factor (ECF subfamily)